MNEDDYGRIVECCDHFRQVASELARLQFKCITFESGGVVHNEPLTAIKRREAIGRARNIVVRLAVAAKDLGIDGDGLAVLLAELNCDERDYRILPFTGDSRMRTPETMQTVELIRVKAEIAKICDMKAGGKPPDKAQSERVMGKPRAHDYDALNHRAHAFILEMQKQRPAKPVTATELAKHLGIANGAVCKLPAWNTEMGLRKKHTRRRPKIASLSGQEAAEPPVDVDDLIDEQMRDMKKGHRVRSGDRS